MKLFRARKHTQIKMKDRRLLSEIFQGKRIVLITLIVTRCLGSDNQTDLLTPVLVDKPLPFSICVKPSSITIPGGIQSSAAGQCESEILLIAGRTNGLHNFNNDNNNFPPSQQNTTIFVVNMHTKKVSSRSLYDPSSGLTQRHIDTLSVTAPQYYQSDETLYITGGYGVDTATGNFSTKDTLTAIDVPGLMHWVKHPNCPSHASKYIRQISNPVFQVTGGAMYQVGKNPTLLIFGQNFAGFYNGSSNGDYTQQVRRFRIVDNGDYLGVIVYPATPPNPNYRRRDLNVVPIVQYNKDDKKVPGFVALSGVFTLNTGIWTVPVEITTNGQPSMADPTLSATFKQGMNNYACPHAELLSKHGNMYTILFGGITFGFFQNKTFQTDSEIPFTNQMTIVKRNRCGLYEQYLLPTQYPVILSKASNPNNQLLFGAGGIFIRACDIPTTCNKVINLKKIKKPTVIGYILGGIQSTLPNTNTSSDSAASPYIFKVILTPHC